MVSVAKMLDLVLILALISLVVTTHQATGLTYTIVDTRVTFYTDADNYIGAPQPGQHFYGQDANYQGNQPSYTDNGDGTISDANTGLMWQKDMGAKMHYFRAQDVAASLTLGGYNDWRIPTIKELYSLILFSGNVFGPTAGTQRFIDTNYFVQPIGNSALRQRDIDAQTLSGTVYTGLAFERDVCNFGVNFVDGRIKCYPQRDVWYFRMVRGNPSYGINSFTNNRDGTISDSATGLMWQQGDSSSGMIWLDALAYCENLNFASHSDWRLPNAKELHSIIDYSRSPWNTRTAAVDPIFNVSIANEPDGTTGFPYYWSGTTLKDGPMPNQAVYVAVGKGYGAPDRWLIDVHGAGCVRSDPKSTHNQEYPAFFGPQWDMQVVFNYVKCVRNI